MDTDSLYLVLARELLDECVQPEMLNSWKANKHLYFPSENVDRMISFQGYQISEKQYSYRTPGLYKEECRAKGIVALNSKTYICYDERGPVKISSKGVQQKRNNLMVDNFKEVLQTGKSHVVENAGFLNRSTALGPRIDTYTQKKVGLSYFYCKRKILDDGISTTYLDI